MIFLLAITVGLLIFLEIDTLAEAIEQLEGVPGPFQGVGLIGIGAVATFLLQVAYEVGKLIRKDTAQHPAPVTVFSGVLAGMLLLWVTGLLIK